MKWFIGSSTTDKDFCTDTGYPTIEATWPNLKDFGLT